jgi:uncharacterized membrane protein
MNVLLEVNRRSKADWNYPQTQDSVTVKTITEAETLTSVVFKLTSAGQGSKLNSLIVAGPSPIRDRLMAAKKIVILIYLLTLAGIFLWIGTIFLAPYLAKESSPFAGFIYALFSPTCHQIPSRCFFVFGHPLAVCARCLGIYAGFLAGTLIYPFLKGFFSPSLPRIKYFISVSIPILLDTAANLFGIWKSTDWFRFLTGLIFGVILPFYFLAGFSDYFIRRRKDFS